MGRKNRGRKRGPAARFLPHPWGGSRRGAGHVE